MLLEPLVRAIAKFAVGQVVAEPDDDVAQRTRSEDRADVLVLRALEDVHRHRLQVAEQQLPRVAFGRDGDDGRKPARLGCGERDRVVRPERNAGRHHPVGVDAELRAQRSNDSVRLLRVEHLVRKPLLRTGAGRHRRRQRRRRDNPPRVFGCSPPHVDHPLGARSRLRRRTRRSPVHREHQRPVGSSGVAAGQLNQHRDVGAVGHRDRHLDCRERSVFWRRHGRIFATAAPHRFLEIVEALAAHRRQRPVRVQSHLGGSELGVGRRPQIRLCHPLERIGRPRRRRLCRRRAAERGGEDERAFHETTPLPVPARTGTAAAGTALRTGSEWRTGTAAGSPRASAP